VVLLGKALGGGVVPVSAVVADADVLGVLRPGQHGSTFGGNPLASAVGRAVVGMLVRGEWQERARLLGDHLEARLGGLVGSGVTAVRALGLWAGVDVDPALGTGKDVCAALAERALTRRAAGRQGRHRRPPYCRPAVRTASGHRPTPRGGAGRPARPDGPGRYALPGYGGASSATTAPRSPIGARGPDVESRAVCRSASALTTAPSTINKTVIQSQNMLIATPAREP
jgi:hypothetical protein